MLKKALEDLKLAKEQQQNKPVLANIEQLIASVGARQSQTYTMQFDGNSCKILMEEAADLTKGLKEILDIAAAEKISNEAECTVLTLDLRMYVTNVKDLLDIFHYVITMCCSFDRQPPEEFQRMKKACKAVGLLWRALSHSVTPKVHIIESRLFLFFEFYGGRTGHLNESPGELAHKDMNVAMRRHSNTAGFHNKLELIKQDELRSRLPAVQRIKSDVRKDHTRDYGEETLTRKKIKCEEQAQSTLTRSAVLDAIIDRVLLSHGHLATY